MSERLSTAWPRACSGLMYAAVPRMTPCRVAMAVMVTFTVPSGQPVPRWFFTTRIPAMEAAVADALETEELGRSMILAPDAFGEQPPTDGAFYHREGVPVMNFLTAPFYLFDAMDTLDKIDRGNLVPLTRATIRIIESTRGVSAAAMRAGVVTS